MTVVERFLKLVSYPTTSDEASETCPSTARQLALAQELVRQMQDMGIADAHVDKDGYVYGTVPANCEKDIPVYGPHRPHGHLARRARREHPRTHHRALRRRRYCPERREAHHAFSGRNTRS